MAKPAIADSFQRLTISTFGGNPVSSVTAKAVIDIIEEDDLRTNADVVGAYFRERLLELQDKHELIGDVRGMGLMQAIELVKDKKTKEPDAAAANRLMESTRKRGLLVGKGGLYANTMRIAPALIVSRPQIDEALRLLGESLREALS